MKVCLGHVCNSGCCGDVHNTACYSGTPKESGNEARANASQLGSCNYFVGSCGPTHPSHPMTSSTTSPSRYGPLNFDC